MNLSNSEFKEIIKRADSEEWWSTREELGYPQFYDKLFDMEREKYNEYLNDYTKWWYRDYKPYMSWLFRPVNEVSERILLEIKKYICERTGIDNNKTTEPIKPIEDFNPEACFNISEENKINLDDYNTNDDISEKLKDVLKSIEILARGDLKRYLAYKAIELGVKLINVNPRGMLKTTILKKIHEFINDESMDCLKPRLEEIYNTLTNSNITSKCKNWEFTVNDLREFLYFGKTPSWLVINVHKKYMDTLILDGENYHFHYFIWRREGDPNTRRANPDETITRDNFRNYSRFQTAGWSRKQLQIFFVANILQIILTKCEIKININLPIYKNAIDKIPTTLMKQLINEYIETNTVEIHMGYISEIKRTIDNEIQRGSEFNRFRVYDLISDKTLYIYIAQILINQALVKKTLEEKISRIRERIDTRGFKYNWQKMCAKLSTWDIEKLRELAAIENIPNYSMKSKRELCKEFADILERTVAEQRRNKIRYIPEPERPQDPNDEELVDLFNRHIQNNLTPDEQRHKQRYPQQYSEKCENKDSLLGDDLTDIRPEFFFTYRHNNKIFCDDIRSLYQYVSSGKRKSPYDRTPFSDELIKMIENTYDKLEKTLVSMKDIETLVPTESILTSKTSDLSGLMFHHAPIENFLNASSTMFREFVMYLEEEHVITEEEVEYIFNKADLITQKITLVDLLTRKIRNDQHIVGGYSTMASIITDVYNSVFSNRSERSESEIDELASESEIDELASESEIDELASESETEISSESDRVILERKAIIFLSKLPVNLVPGLHQSKILSATGTKLTDFIRILIERELLSPNKLHEWVQQNLLTSEGVPVEQNVDKLKIQLLQTLIQSIESSENRQEIVQKIVRTLLLTRVFS